MKLRNPFTIYSKSGLIRMRRELSLAKLSVENTDKLEKDFFYYEYRLNRPERTGTGDTGPR